MINWSRRACRLWKGCQGYLDPFPLQVAQFPALPSLEILDAEPDQRPQFLRDFSVNVQGAAGGGTAEGPAVWLGTLQQPPELDVRGRIGVVQSAAVDCGIESGFELYLKQHEAARNLGLSALLRVQASVGTRKVMIHRHEEPSIPSQAISTKLAERIFPGGRELGAAGARVRLESPVSFREVTSAGNVVGSLGAGPVRCVVSAHYDHIGALPDGRYFAGASDNASGVAAVLEVARACAEAGWPEAGRAVFLFTSGKRSGWSGPSGF